MWLIFAILSAFFAAAKSILAKIGIDGVDSNLATAIRTVVVLLMAWGIVFVTHAEEDVSQMAHIRSYTADDGSHRRQYRSMGRYEALASQDDAQEVQVWHTRNNHYTGRLSDLSANKF